MKTKSIWIGILGVSVLGIGWWLISPLFLDKQVNEAAPSSSEEMMKEDDMQKEESKEEMIDQEMMGKEYKGNFKDGDKQHMASGLAKTILLDNKSFLRFENFNVTNGPDLHVYLVKTGMETKDGIDLGKLKGNKGDQNYMLPEGTDLSTYQRVVIWCKSFNVDFGYAELAQ